MVEEDRYCGDILLQINAVQQALRSVGRKVLGAHLKQYLAKTTGIRSSRKVERISVELLSLIENA